MLGTAIETYIRAKDGNRPHLIDRAFEATACANMVMRTGNMSFPPAMSGTDAIAEALVRRFGETYENVYTFCLCARPEPQARRLTCDWLVGMSEKAGGGVRVGAGRYDWTLGRERIEALTITIDAMQTLDPAALRPVMDWLAALPYPWCASADILAHAPRMTELAPVLARVADGGRAPR